MDAYSVEKLLNFKGLGIDAECIASYGDTLLVAVKSSELIKYRVKCASDGSRTKQKVPLDSSIHYVFKKPVSMMHCIPECSLLLAVYDSVMNVHNLDTFELKGPIPSTKGIAQFDVSVYVDGKQDLPKSIQVKMCVAIGRKLKILEWNGETFVDTISNLLLSRPSKGIMWCKDNIIVAFKDEYLLLKPETFDVKEIFKYGTGQLEPLMTRIDENRIIVGYQNRSIFLDNMGKHTKLEPINWSGIPKMIVLDMPYLLAVFPKYIEVRSTEPSIFIQQIDIKNASAIAKGRGIIFVKTRNSVYTLTLQPKEERVKKLIDYKKFELAMNIEQLSDLSQEEKLLQVNKIKAIMAVNLFCNLKFKEAMDIFLTLQTDPSHVVSLLPDLVPFSNSLEYPEKIPSIHGQDLEKAFQSLTDYLLEKRIQIQKDPKPFTPIMDHKRNDVLKKSDQALTVIDTTLLKCYLQIHEEKIVSLICKPGVMIHLQEAEKALSQNHKYLELVELYKKNNMHNKALAILKTQSAKPKSRLYGLDFMVHYIQKLGEVNLPLVFEYGQWVLETDVTQGMKIFTEDCPEVLGLPRGHVLSFIEKVKPSMAIQYLEHIVYKWNDTTKELHQSLGNHLTERVMKLYEDYTSTHFTKDCTVCMLPKVGTEKGPLDQYRQQLIKFIETTHLYNPEELLVRLPMNDFFEERALLLGKMGRHSQTLGIYCYILENSDQAEKYCEKVNKDSNPSNVYMDLLNVYLIPPAPVTLGLKEFQHKPNPKIENAIRLLEEHSTCIDALKAIELLPDDMPIKNIAHFLEDAINLHVTYRYMCQIHRNIEFYNNLKTSSEKCQFSRQAFMIEDNTSCNVCQKKIGIKSIFAIRSSGEIVHYACLAV